MCLFVYGVFITDVPWSVVAWLLMIIPYSIAKRLAKRRSLISALMDTIC